MEYFDDYISPIADQQQFDFYEIKELFEKRLVYGAPHADIYCLRKILNTDAVFEESPETQKPFEDTAMHTGGIRLRFRTNSNRLVIKAELKRKWSYLKMNMYNSSGFDVYVVNGRSRHHITVVAPQEPNNIFAHMIYLPGDSDYEIWFPTYNAVLNFSIGVAKGSTLAAARPLTDERAVIFYGHSATQGASASRSGNAYPNIVARKLDCEIFNYSFSAACRAERATATQIADAHEDKNVKALVIDYSRNAKSLEEFTERYMPFYDIIREKYPFKPIILVGAFESVYYDNIIRPLFKQMRARGDNTYFLDLHALFEDVDILSVSMDNLHYTDTGMFMIADRICEILNSCGQAF